jgi:hypothetical protein
VGHHGPRRNPDAPLECFWRITAKRTILAAGALERMIAFANNDRPWDYDRIGCAILSEPIWCCGRSNGCDIWQ